MMTKHLLSKDFPTENSSTQLIRKCATQTILFTLMNDIKLVYT